MKLVYTGLMSLLLVLGLSAMPATGQSAITNGFCGGDDGGGNLNCGGCKGDKDKDDDKSVLSAQATLDNCDGDKDKDKESATLGDGCKKDKDKDGESVLGDGCKKKDKDEGELGDGCKKDKDKDDSEL